MSYAFLFSTLFGVMACCSACSAFEDGGSDEAGKARSGEFCYKNAAAGRSRQISLDVSDDCPKYSGGYIPYIGDEAVVTRALIWWRGDGRRIVAGFAREKAEIGLAKMIEEGGQPLLIAYGKEEVGRGVEAHFSAAGFNYIVLLSYSDMSPLDIKVWQ